MKLPWTHSSEPTDATASATPEEHQEEAQPLPKGYTPKKGHPTPKRNAVERARGIRHDPVKPAQTPKELRARRKALKESMTRAEWKEHKHKLKAERVQAQRSARDAMDRGDERYLLARDKGPEKQFLRDWVDSRRFISGILMPFALVLLAAMVVTVKSPTIANYVSLVGLIVMLIFLGDAIVLGRKAAKALREKYPDCAEKNLSLGFYAWSRATQVRRLRSPRPRVAVGQHR